MSHHNLGDTSGAVAGSATDGNASFWTGDTALTAPAEIWVDTVWMWIGVSVDRTIQGACYFGSQAMAGGASQSGTCTAASGVVFHGLPYALNSGTNNGGGTSPYLHFVQGDTFLPGVSLSGGSVTIGLDNSGGSYYCRRVASLPSTDASMTQNLDGNPPPGRPHYYASYWDKCAIYTIPTSPVQVGTVFQITGTSFNAGMNNVYIGTVPVTTYTIDSDSQMSLTVPATAISGTINLDSKAGNIFSSGTLQVGPGGWYKQGGTIHRFVGGWVKNSGALQPMKAGFYKSGGVPNQTK